jgi:hypothetical protein
VTSTPGAVTSALSAVPSMVGTAVAFDGFRRGVADTLGLRLRRVVNRTVPGLQLVDVGAILRTPHDAHHGATANAHHGAPPLSSTRLMMLCAACECPSRRPTLLSRARVLTTAPSLPPTGPFGAPFERVLVQIRLSLSAEARLQGAGTALGAVAALVEGYAGRIGAPDVEPTLVSICL